MLRPHVDKPARFFQPLIFLPLKLLGVYAFDIFKITAVDEAPLVARTKDSEAELMPVACHVCDLRAEKSNSQECIFRSLKSNQSGCCRKLFGLCIYAREIIADDDIFSLSRKRIDLAVHVYASNQLVHRERGLNGEQFINADFFNTRRPKQGCCQNKNCKVSSASHSYTDSN